MSMDEQRLRDLLVDASEDARPATGAIAAASRKGQRLRRRRQALAGSASVLVIGVVAVGAIILASPPHPGPSRRIGPTAESGHPLTAAMRSVGRIETLWQGQRDGQPRTVAVWFTADDNLCLGEPVPGGYTNVNCAGGEPHDDGRAGFYGWDGTAAGVPNLDDGTHTWFLLRVGRGATRITVTLTTGVVIPATLHLTDGPQAQVLAVAIAPPHSTASQLTAYDAGGHQIDTAHP
jgi:hypothetical protein